jgi:hypothetical protein
MILKNKIMGTIIGCATLLIIAFGALIAVKHQEKNKTNTHSA